MKHTRPQLTRTELRDRIREVGLRSTPARLSVLELLEHAPAPLSHAEVAQGLSDLEVDLATVYRNLIDLTEANLVSRVDLGDHTWRFVIKRESHDLNPEHPHFICTDCGTISCLLGADPDIGRAARRQFPVIGEVSEILIKGQCHDCADTAGSHDH